MMSKWTNDKDALFENKVSFVRTGTFQSLASFLVLKIPPKKFKYKKECFFLFCSLLPLHANVTLLFPISSKSWLYFSRKKKYKVRVDAATFVVLAIYAKNEL